MGARRVLWLSLFGLGLLAGILAVAAYVVYGAVGQYQQRHEAASRAGLRNPRVEVVFTQNVPFDPRDEGSLVRGSEEVFVGRVERLTGREDNDPLPFLESWAPQAQFRVRVTGAVKAPGPGTPAKGDTVIVNQMGVPPEDALADVSLANEVDGDPTRAGETVPARFLRVGQYYVFATEHEPRRGWHTTRVDPFGWMVLGEEMGGGERRLVARLPRGGP